MIGQSVPQMRAAHLNKRQHMAQHSQRHTVGYDTLVGSNGYDTLVGDSSGGQTLSGMNPGAAGPVVFVNGAPTAGRQLPLGVAATTVAATTGTATITSAAQIVFRPLRLMFFETYTGLSYITQLTIGNNSQLINSAIALPTQAFANNATDSLINFDTCNVGQNFLVGVLNTASSTLTFQGLVIAVAAVQR